MTDRISEIRARCEAATLGEWKVKIHNEEYGQGYGETTYFVDIEGELLKIGLASNSRLLIKYRSDTDFIANARTDIPYLLDRITALETEKAELLKQIVALAGETVREPHSDKHAALTETELAVKAIEIALKLPIEVEDISYPVYAIIEPAVFAALAALNEQAKREKGCCHCKNITPLQQGIGCSPYASSVRIAKDGVMWCRNEAIRIKFCPNCGADMRVGVDA